MVRSGNIAPALSIRTSSRGSFVAIRSTASRTERSDAMSATTAVARSGPCAATSSSRTDSSRAGSRPTRTTRAPSPARRPAIARPSPDVGPVTRTVRPRRASAGGSDQSNRRRRTVLPIREKLPTIDNSSRSSISMVSIAIEPDDRGGTGVRSRRRSRVSITPGLADPQPRPVEQRARAGSRGMPIRRRRAGQAAGPWPGPPGRSPACRSPAARACPGDAVPSTATTTCRALSPTAGLAAEPIAKTL